jgi:MFS family permease
LVGYQQLGVLLAISFLIQAIFDYPSGVIGDWIGQRWVLFVAYLGYGLAFGVLFFADSFNYLIIVYILQALASSQMSGAFPSWFENNYKISSGESDKDREIFKFLQGRWTAIGRFAFGLSFLVGGFIAFLHYRELVFGIQAVIFVILAVVFLVTIKNLPGIEIPEKTVKNYFRLMYEGIHFSLTNKVMIFMMLGISFSAGMWIIWGSMILFPLYFSYTGSDAGAASYRFIVFLLGLPGPIFASNLSKKFDIKWFPRLAFFHVLFFFTSFIVIFEFYPINDNNNTEFQLIPLLLCVIPFVIPSIIFSITEILQSRIFLDLIPDRNRNSVYSLIPTVVLLFNTPSALIGGYLIENSGFTVTLFFLIIIGCFSAFCFLIAVHLLKTEKIDKIEKIEQPIQVLT